MTLHKNIVLFVQIGSICSIGSTRPQGEGFKYKIQFH